MKLTKYDYIQIALNAVLIAGTVLNVLFLTGVLPQFVTTISLGLVIVGCIFTNTSTGKSSNGMRQEVSGIKALAALSYVTGALWIISYGCALFFPIDFGE